MTLVQPLKWHGGKHYLAKRIVEMMPPRVINSNAPAQDDPGWVHYVEPFFGGGAVLLANDPEGISEVVNDLHGQLTNFWSVLQSQPLFNELQILLEATPCSAIEFNRAKQLLSRCHGHSEYPAVHLAAAFLIVNRQSRQALGKDFATLARNRTRQGMNELPSAWLSAIDGLPEVHQRLKRVVILNDNACNVIRQQDGPRTLFYCDPPYVHSTRSSTGEYKYEMTVEQHKELLHVLSCITGRFILSGYDSDLYHEFAQDHGWSCDTLEIDNKASSKKTKEKKVECLWRNYA